MIAMGMLSSFFNWMGTVFTEVQFFHYTVSNRFIYIIGKQPDPIHFKLNFVVVMARHVMVLIPRDRRNIMSHCHDGIVAITKPL